MNFLHILLIAVGVILAEPIPQTTPVLPHWWLGFIQSGLNVIQSTYPSAQIFDVESTVAAEGELVTVGSELSNITIYTQDNMGVTYTISSFGYGAFGAVVVLGRGFVSDAKIGWWPISLDIDSALNLIYSYGIDRCVSACSLRYPLYPGITEPYYEFILDNGTGISVGSTDLFVGIPIPFRTS